MTKAVWTGVLAVLSVGLLAAPMTAAQDLEPRRQARIERQERIRERMEARREGIRHRLRDQRMHQLERLRLDRNADGWVTRHEAARYRSELRRAIRRSVR